MFWKWQMWQTLSASPAQDMPDKAPPQMVRMMMVIVTKLGWWSLYCISLLYFVVLQEQHETLNILNLHGWAWVCMPVCNNGSQHNSSGEGEDIATSAKQLLCMSYEETSMSGLLQSFVFEYVCAGAWQLRPWFMRFSKAFLALDGFCRRTDCCPGILSWPLHFWVTWQKSS